MPSMQYGHFTSPQPCPQQSHLQRENQEWHARMATFGINKVYIIFLLLSHILQ